MVRRSHGFEERKMKISRAIELLQEIQERFGDIRITGGSMAEDIPLSSICVTDIEGMEIWPRNPNGLNPPFKIDGVFFE